MKKKFTLPITILLVASLLAACGASGSSTSSTEDAGDAVDVSQTLTDDNSVSDAMLTAAALVGDIPTTQSFTNDAVSEEDLNAILLAGINAPSAMNGQPWHFTAVTSASVMEEIANSMSFGGGNDSPAPDAPTSPNETDATEREGNSAPAEGDAPDSPASAMPAAPSGGMTRKAGVGDSPLAIIISCEEDSEYDAGLATQAMSTEAVLLGYGTKIVTSPTIALNGEKQAYFKELLEIPENQTACAVLLIGYPADSEESDTDTVTSATTRNPMSDMVTYVQ